MRFGILKKCPCATNLSREAVEMSIDDLWRSTGSVAHNVDPASTYKLRFPKETSQALETSERVLQNEDIWLVFVTGNGAARWLAADGFAHLDPVGNKFARYIRGRRCCVRCAVNFVTPPAIVLL
jgi:hypothetical protein